MRTVAGLAWDGASVHVLREATLRKRFRSLAFIGAGVLAISSLGATAAGASSPPALGGEVGQAMRHATERVHGHHWFPQRGPTVLTSGLDNPRQLDFVAGDNALLIAEAGRGGSACSGTGEDATCVGATGKISAVLLPWWGANRHATTIVRGMLSGAGPDGSFAVGSDGVSAVSPFDIKIQETFAPPDVLPSGLPGEQSGKLLRAHPFGAPQVEADITGYEAAHDPDHQGFDSDPYAVLAQGRRTLVTDAAGNDVLSVDRHGNVSLFKVFPNVQTGACKGVPNDAGTTGCDFVPDSIAEGPDGAIYVGGLAGETPGAGTVVKLDPRTGATLKTWTGFTTVTGVAVARDGSLYVSELFGGDPNAPVPGQITRVSRWGSRHSMAVPFPAGIVLDHHGTVYVAAFSTAPSTGLGIPGQDTSGQIWRLRF
jgi:hypothetical protein